jgi:hypothetical protein
MKKVILTALIVFLSFSIFAQFGGFIGKRLLLKTTIIDGKYVPCRNAELEFALFRNLSISFGYQYFKSYNVGQRIKKEYEFTNTQSGGSPNVSDGFSERAYLQSSTFYYILKLYTNRMLPAPRGFYFYWQNGFGKASVSAIGANNIQGAYHFIEDKVPVMTYGFGIGRQAFLNKFITLDFALGFSGAVLKDNGFGSQKNTGLVAPYWGSNLFSFTSFSNLPVPGDFDIDTEISASSLKRKNDSFGLDFRIKLGFLIF